MRYEILNRIKVGSNTAVTVSGNGEGLKNGIILSGDDSLTYRILSIGMTAGIDPDEISVSTEILVEGNCDANFLIA